MKNFTFFAILLTFFSINTLFSATGDTIEVRTIEFQEPRQGWYDFPEEGTSIERIMMNYKLRCPPGKPCGEWDYIVNLFIRNYYAPNYQFNGRSPDTTFYLTSHGWDYIPIYDGENVIGLDSVETEPIWLYTFDINSENPTEPTDSIEVWQRYYKDYVIEDGQIVDSTLSDYDEFIALEKKRVYFNDDVTIFDQIEIFRYITPYGNGLDLGPGFNWQIEMTDFRPYLTGKVYFYAPSSPGWQKPMDQNHYEDLELTFDFVEGTPERDILSLEHLWTKTILYNKDYENSFPPFEHTFDENVKNARFKLIQTGHGFGDDEENCSEFCQKDAFLFVNEQEIWKKNVWRECGDNPVFPQGGTWLADRTNWCPGAEVVPYDIELSDYIESGGSVTLNYDMEYYEPVKIQNDPSDFPGRYMTTAYIVSYGDLNFQYDVEITDVISPNNKQMFRRFNPTCSNPTIVIRNRGSETITNLDVIYSINGGDEYTFAWNGNLDFSEQDTVMLEGIAWENREEGNYFNVRLENPNGMTDEYPTNNDAFTEFDQVPVFFKETVLEFRTVNYDAYNASSPYRYFVFNADGDIIESRSSTQNSKLYADTLKLEKGCYTFLFMNIYGYGLSYWPLNRLNNGYLKFEKQNVELKRYNPDFGNTIYQQFIVDDHPEITTKESADTLFIGEVDKGEKVSNTFTLVAANDKPVIVKNIEIKLGFIKGFTIKSITPEIGDSFELTRENGIDIEVEYEGKLNGNQSIDLEITSENTFLPITRIPLKAITFDPSSVEQINEYYVDIYPVYGRNNDININYYSDINEYANISINDILGNQVEVLYDGFLQSGENQINFDQNKYQSGVYFITLRTKDKIVRNKLILTK
jgi:hypothetical protein